jgi:hypothetical protein
VETDREGRSRSSLFQRQQSFRMALKVDAQSRVEYEETFLLEGGRQAEGLTESGREVEDPYRRSHFLFLLAAWKASLGRYLTHSFSLVCFLTCDFSDQSSDQSIASAPRDYCLVASRSRRGKHRHSRQKKSLGHCHHFFQKSFSLLHHLPAL